MTLLILSWLLRRRRRWQRPAAALFVLLATGCASQPGADPIDPLEPMNRRVFAFNDAADRAVMAPLARGYRKVTPMPVRRGIGNLFANLGDLGHAINSSLQGRPGRAGSSVARVLLNSTVGVFGLFDVATPLGVRRQPTDFGETLAVWGVDQGPYLVLPLLGPATARSGLGTGVDIVMMQQWQPGGLSVTAAGAVDTRSRLLDAEALISGDRYLFIRDAYLQRRAAQLGETLPLIDNFSDDEALDWGE